LSNKKTLGNYLVTNRGDTFWEPSKVLRKTEEHMEPKEFHHAELPFIPLAKESCEKFGICPLTLPFG
jgi:hypothetical protein